MTKQTNRAEKSKENPAEDDGTDLFTFIIYFLAFTGTLGIISIVIFNEVLAGHWTALFLLPLPTAVVSVLKLFV